MTLAATQRAFAQICTNREAREELFDDPASAANRWGMAPADAAELAGASEAGIRFFASQLQRKRLNEVARLLPATRALLGPSFGRLFLEFAEAAVQGGIRKHEHDALAFAAFLWDRTELLAGWCVERDSVMAVLRYEAGWVQASDPGATLVVRCFRHDIRELARGIQINTERPRPPLCPTIAFWYRLPPRRRLRHAILSLSSRRA